MIKKCEDGTLQYFDRNGIEVLDGDYVLFSPDDPKDKPKRLYLTTEGTLGTDATNPYWIETGRAVPCQYDIYPLTWGDTEHMEKVEPAICRELERARR